MNLLSQGDLDRGAGWVHGDQHPATYRSSGISDHLSESATLEGGVKTSRVALSTHSSPSASEVRVECRCLKEAPEKDLQPLLHHTPEGHGTPRLQREWPPVDPTSSGFSLSDSNVGRRRSTSTRLCQW